MTSHVEKAAVYWNAYELFEKEIIDLSLYVFFDDKNIVSGIHSMKIADLILRIATFIESISKDIYLENGGTGERDRILYDNVCLWGISQKWNLRKREIFLTLNTGSISKKKHKVFTPLNYTKTKPWKKTKVPVYSWNEAYQALKHNLIEAIPQYANLYNLLNIAAMFYLLVIYYDDKEYYLGSSAVPEKISFKHKLFAPNMSGLTKTSSYVAIYYGPEWEDYTKRANQLYSNGQDIQKDFNCQHSLKFSRQKLVLHKSQSVQDVCPGLSAEVLKYIKKINQ